MTCMLLEGNGDGIKAEIKKMYAEMGKMQATLDQMVTIKSHWERDVMEARKIMMEQVNLSEYCSA